MPTPLGWGVLASSVMCYVLAWLSGYPELGVPAVAGMLAVLGAVAWTLPKPRLEVHREIAPARVPRGDAAIGLVTIVNRGRRVRAGLRAGDVCGERMVDVVVPALPPGARRTVSYRLPTRRRGHVPVGPLRLLRTDPFGLARRVQQYGGREWVLVHPRLYAMPPLPSGRDQHLDGPTSDTAPSGTTAFHALREYVMGDDLRHVHWRTTARTGKLMTRHLVATSLPLTTMVLDLRPDSYAGFAPPGPRAPGSAAVSEVDRDDPPPADEGFELALDAAASVTVDAIRRNFPVRLVTSAGRIVDGNGGRTDADRLLELLARLDPDPDGGLAGAFESLRQGRRGGFLVIVTGAGRSAELASVSARAKGYDRVVVIRVGGSGGATPAGVRAFDVAGGLDLVANWQREGSR